MQTRVINNIAIVQSETPLITDTQSALDLIATISYEHQVTSVIINMAAVDERFFDLSTRLAGDILQKFVTYQMKLAIVGDFSHYPSQALHDFIYESNQGSHIFFASSEADALAKLAGATHE